MTLHFAGDTVQLFHPHNAHTDSDTLVHFKRANVIHASGPFGGDGSYPFFDMSSSTKARPRTRPSPRNRPRISMRSGCAPGGFLTGDAFARMAYQSLKKR